MTILHFPRVSSAGHWSDAAQKSLCDIYLHRALQVQGGKTASSCSLSSCPQGCGRAVCRHAYSIHKQPKPTKQDGHFYSLKNFLKFTEFCWRTTNLWKSYHKFFFNRSYLRSLGSKLKCWAFLSQSLFSVLIVSMLRKMSLASRNSRIYLLEKALSRAT